MLRDINTLPSLYPRPHRDISVQKRLGPIDELLKGARQNLTIGISTGAHRVTKQHAHDLVLYHVLLRIAAKKEDTSIGRHDITATSHKSTLHTYERLLY